MPGDSDINFRTAQKDDVMDLWRWRNDRLARRNSLRSRVISLREHKRWFQSTLKKGRNRIYIATDHGKKIGMIRFDADGKNIAEVSVNINPLYRGKGYGKRVLVEGLGFFNAEQGSKIQKAVIKTNNEASKKIFSSAGFVKLHEVKELGYSVWIKK